MPSSCFNPFRLFSLVKTGWKTEIWKKFWTTNRDKKRHCHWFTADSLAVSRCTTHVQSYCTGLFSFVTVPILSKLPDALTTIRPYTVKNSNLVHFIGQIRALGPLCSDPSWGWQVALNGPPQREFHRSTAGDAIKLDRFAESSSVRKIYFSLCSNQAPGFLYISYTPL